MRVLDGLEEEVEEEGSTQEVSFNFCEAMKYNKSKAYSCRAVNF